MKRMHLPGLMIVAGIAMACAAPSFARENVTVTLDPNSVAFAYNDGYWDRDHQWHKWRDAKETREFREQHKDHFYAWNHDRDKDLGWHDIDHH